MIKVFPDKAGGWRFHVKGANGEIVAQSEAYTRRADAERGTEALARAVETEFQVSTQAVESFLENEIEALPRLTRNPVVREVLRTYLSERLRTLQSGNIVVQYKGGE